MKTALLCLILTASAALAAPPMPPADPPGPAPVAPPFILPPSPPTPPTPPAPVGTPIPLVPGKPFVIRLNAATVLASPEGLVRMKTKAEPLTVVDADGVDTEYSGDKSVCFVWPVKGASGPVELLIVPTDGSAIGRVSLIVGNPVPPTPPTPPGPTDPLAATLQAAYGLDTDANKAANVKWLASVYFNAPGLLSPPPANVSALFSELSKSIHAPSGFPAGGMPHLMTAIGTELNTTLNPSLSATTAVDATKAAAEFAKISAALSGVK